MTWAEVVKVADYLARARGVRYRVTGRRYPAGGWWYVAEPVVTQ